MSDCGPLSVMDGGAVKDADIINPTVTGGEATNLTLVHAHLEGGLTADAEALEDLAAGLAPHLDIRGYVDCHGAPVSDGAGVATCGNLEERVQAASQALDQKFSAADAALTARLDCDKEALENMVAVATDPERIAGVFKRRDGTQMGSGAQLLTMDEVADAIADALAASGTMEPGAEIASFTWNAVTGTLSIVESKNGSFLPAKSVVLGGLMPAPLVTASPPSAYTIEDSLPTAVRGSRNVLLGDPSYFLRMNLGGVEGWMPFFTL
jgi:hypothetical protein